MRALLIKEIDVVSGAGILDKIVSPVPHAIRGVVGGVGLIISIPTIVLGAIAGVPTLGLGFVVMTVGIVGTALSATLLKNR